STITASSRGTRNGRGAAVGASPTSRSNVAPVILSGSSACRVRRASPFPVAPGTLDPSGAVHALDCSRDRFQSGIRKHGSRFGGPPLFGKGTKHPQKIGAHLLHGTLVAKRLRSADPPAVQNQGVRRASPAVLRHCRAQLLFDDGGIVRLGNADTICHPQHMTIDG